MQCLVNCKWCCCCSHARAQTEQPVKDKRVYCFAILSCTWCCISGIGGGGWKAVNMDGMDRETGSDTH